MKASPKLCAALAGGAAPPRLPAHAKNFRTLTVLIII